MPWHVVIVVWKKHPRLVTWQSHLFIHSISTPQHLYSKYFHHSDGAFHQHGSLLIGKKPKF